jgi:hypothetical protein
MVSDRIGVRIPVTPTNKFKESKLQQFIDHIKTLRQRQIDLVQPLADQAEPNDRAMAYLVARLLGVKVTHHQMKHNL